jgi:hypothetical protein
VRGQKRKVTTKATDAGAPCDSPHLRVTRIAPATSKRDEAPAEDMQSASTSALGGAQQPVKLDDFRNVLIRCVPRP